MKRKGIVFGVTLSDIHLTNAAPLNANKTDDLSTKRGNNERERGLKNGPNCSLCLSEDREFSHEDLYVIRTLVLSVISPLFSKSS